MVEVTQGAVTHARLLELTLASDIMGEVAVRSARFGVVVAGKTLSLGSDFQGLNETPEMREAINALISATEKSFAAVVGLSAPGETASPRRTTGLGRG